MLSPNNMGNVSVQCERGEDGKGNMWLNLAYFWYFSIFVFFSSYKGNHQNKITYLSESIYIDLRGRTREI